jgi:hypothetical protein
MDPGQAHDFGAAHIEFRQGGGEGDSLGQPMFGQAAGGFRLEGRVQDIGARGRSRSVAEALPLTRGEKIVIVLR